MISNKSMDYLFDTLNFYGKQFDAIADSCFNDVKRALMEIAQEHLPADAYVLPYGSYNIKSNYQVVEPMEFYVVLHGDKDKVLSREYEQKQASLKFKKRKKQKGDSVKDIYQNILGGSSNEQHVVTSFDAAKTIMEQMKKYLGENDVAYYKNNTVFVRFNTQQDIQILAIITVVYEFDEDLFEFKKYGISTREHSRNILNNIMQKNAETSGNYLVLCKLVKMLELELIISELSEKHLSKKSLFVEHILYNVPNVLYKGNNFCTMFTNITNYIKHCNFDNILLADNTTKMFPEHGYYAKKEFNSFIKKLVYLCQNTDQMIEDAIKQYAKTHQQNTDDNDNKPANNQNQKNVKKLGK